MYFSKSTHSPLSISSTSVDSSGKDFVTSFYFCRNTASFSFNGMQGPSAKLPSFAPYLSRHSWQTYRLLLVNIPFLKSSSKRFWEHLQAVTSCNFNSLKVTLTIFFPTVGIPCFSCEHDDCKVTGLSVYSGQNIYYKIKTSSAHSPQTNSWFNKRLWKFLARHVI